MDSPRMSLRFARLVVPMMGAATGSFAKIQARETCAMLAPFFLAISSTLGTQTCKNGETYTGVCERDTPARELRQECGVVDVLVSGVAHVSVYDF